MTQSCFLFVDRQIVSFTCFNFLLLLVFLKKNECYYIIRKNFG